LLKVKSFCFYFAKNKIFKNTAPLFTNPDAVTRFGRHDDKQLTSASDDGDVIVTLVRAAECALKVCLKSLRFQQKRNSQLRKKRYCHLVV